MKKYILLIIPFIISCSSPEPINADVMLIERGGEYFSAAKNKPYSGPFFTLHDNGELKSEGNLKKGNLDDAFKEYSESGQILTDVTYKNGILNGPYKEYFKYLKGQVSEKGTYKNGKKKMGLILPLALTQKWYGKVHMTMENPMPQNMMNLMREKTELFILKIPINLILVHI